MIIENYTFDPVTGKITFLDFASIRLEGVKLITNLLTGTIIYQFNSSAKLGTVLANVLTLAFSTTGMNSSDKLMIVYDDITVATSDASLVALNNMVETLKQMLYLLKPLGIATSGSNRLQSDIYNIITGTIAAVTAVTTVTTVTTLANQTNIGGVNAFQQMKDLSTAGFGSLRSRIV